MSASMMAPMLGREERDTVRKRVGAGCIAEKGLKKERFRGVEAIGAMRVLLSSPVANCSHALVVDKTGVTVDQIKIERTNG
jgi:hypothetical protein